MSPCCSSTRRAASPCGRRVCVATRIAANERRPIWASSSLRDVQDRGLTVLDAVTDPVDARRARHVLAENQRVLDFVAALSDFDFSRPAGYSGVACVDAR